MRRLAALTTALLAAAPTTRAFLQPTPRRVAVRAAAVPISPEDGLSDETLEQLQLAATRMALERRHTRAVTTRPRRYLPYADAARWARGLGLRTEEDWRDWLDVGEGRTTYVPTDPEAHYRPRGEWVSWRHFLAGAAEDDAAAPAPEVLPQTYFETLDYATGAPWDLAGRPQPAIRKAFARGDFGATEAGPVLDCGCGAGDNANWLAARGHAVLGFDLCPSAVAEARRRAATDFAEPIARARGAATFVEASCVDLEASPVRRAADECGGFPVALDSALAHCLDDADQRRYVAQLAKVVRIGGRVYLGCFSDANPDPWSNPRRLSEAHVRALFAPPTWRVVSVDPAWYERPRALNGKHGMGAFTMAWWCAIDRGGAM